MMTNKTTGVCVVSLMAVTACTSTSSGSSSSCTDISGNYSVTVERVSGTCDPALDARSETVGVQRATDGTWTVILPNIEGGCPGTLDAATCKFTSACEVRDSSGALLGNASVSYTFTSTGYVGSSVVGLRPPSVATACDVTYRETGTRL